MSIKVKGALPVALVGACALVMTGGARADHMPGVGTADSATGGGLEAAAIGALGNTEFDESTATRILDLPALPVDRDANGRIRMDLPALTLYGPGKGAPAAPGRLPQTGVDAGSLFASGMAELSAGGIFVRRLLL